ncbi:hypothetical protein A1O7_06511 [Cladophialophora yegresii CBS 114405]|uniref:Myb-like domain-containing protein n=1 Tax=Cladophialophora yegresii CBS 114405 TaxID=1182544 RepID=W9W261_9EURO|nr:uncharacterized protein A1O7_06511 [Cladophialophora yegresii CBS 114405]EXJ59080.1 hypothetical protein A1O7_06511 [Cladophialophora yegresii CBS 114405]
MPMVWNDEADARLFTAVLATTDVKIDWKAVAALMGPECTTKALNHRIAAIKKKAGLLATGGGIASPTPASPATPASAKKATPRKRAAKGAMEAEAEDDENDDNGAPVSKKAKAKKTSTPKVAKKAAPTAADATHSKGCKKVKCESEDEDDGAQD